MRGVIAGEVVGDIELQPGDAFLVLEEKEFSGSVIEICDGEIVFSTPEMAEMNELLSAESEEDEAVADIVRRGRQMGF